MRPGWLVQAFRQAREGPALLVVDEVNRADLGKVLGEAIYLFEAGEAGGAEGRRIRLPHPVDGDTELRVPDGFHLLATMNTADRSIQHLDLAVRRRFAFVTMPPDRRAVEEHAPEEARRFFDQLCDVFSTTRPTMRSI